MIDGKKLLLVSHRGERCGVQQFGRNLFWMLRSAKQVKTEYWECGDAAEFENALAEVKPGVILFNYHSVTLPWLTPEVRAKVSLPTFAIAHEIHQGVVDNLSDDGFDFTICVDPTIIATNPRAIVVPRIIPDPISPAPPRHPPTIGSFGFATPGKGFDRLCRLANEQFDEAIIRINIPYHDNPQLVPIENAAAVAEQCRRAITKPGIRLEVTHKFLDRRALVRFLAGNTLNAFLYSDNSRGGLSSCVDFALAAGQPLAVTRTVMFRHLHKINPSVCIEDAALPRIIENGFGPLERFREQFLKKNALKQWLAAINEALERRAFSMSVPDRRGLNKLLDDRSRQAYESTIGELHSLAPKFVARKPQDEIVQHAFGMDAVERMARRHGSPRILAVGTFEDAAVEALKNKGYRIETIDASLNVDLNEFYLSSSGVQGSFDIAMCLSVLQHVKDDELFVRQIADLLAPDGYAIFTIDFRDDLVDGDSKPQADFRLYSSRDIINRLMHALPDCVLADAHTWGDGVSDIEHDGASYGFASWVFRKSRDAPIEYANAHNLPLRTAPWKDQVRSLKESSNAKDKLAAERNAEALQLRDQVRSLKESSDAKDKLAAERDVEALQLRDSIQRSHEDILSFRNQIDLATRLIDGVKLDLAGYDSPVASPSMSGRTALLSPRQLLDLSGCDFVANAYRTLLRREPDDFGLENFVGALHRGQGKLEVILAIRFSPEGARANVDVSSIWIRLLLARLYRLPTIGQIIRVTVEFLNWRRVSRAQRDYIARVMNELRQSRSAHLAASQALVRAKNNVARIDATLSGQRISHSNGAIASSDVRLNEGDVKQ